MADGVPRYAPQRLANGIVLASTSEPVHYCCPVCAKRANHLVIMYVTWSGEARTLTCSMCNYQVQADDSLSQPPGGPASQSFANP